ncbi:MAG: ABC transporter substrate-binding protein [Nocardioides sp.]|uniref:ABC transporter substrate-binding protein n=1 Tax=Nocardioides sp. TaxID=35761 RepID=UPI0039E549C5
MLTATIAVLGLVVTACGGGSGGGAAASFSPTVATTAPSGSKAVDTITWNLPSGEPSSLDPAMSALESVSTVVANMCEPLMRWGDDYQQEPGLATSVDHPNRTTWVFHLRTGVKFWNGTTMTAADVVYSLKRILDPATASSWAGWAPEGATVKATGGDTVTVTVPHYGSAMESYFATPAFTIVSKAYAQKEGKAFGTAQGGVMCTGPYQLASWKSGQSITLKANPNYWDTADEPAVKTAKFTFVTDQSAQIAGLQSGDIDGQFTVPVSAYSQLQKAGGHLLFANSLAPTFLSVLDSSGALGDPKIRQALQKTVDYQGIVDAVYHGAATPLRALVPPAAWGYAEGVYQAGYDALPEPSQDLAAAAALVKRSSRASEKIVLAYTSASTEETKAATAIADSATSIGLDVELKPLTAEEFGALFSSAQARKGIDLMLVSGYLDFPDPVTYYQYFTAGSFYNFNGYSNKRYTALINAALSEPDEDAKAADVVKAQAIMAKDLINIPILTQYVSVYYGKDLGGYLPSQDYLYSPWLAQLGGA